MKRKLSTLIILFPAAAVSFLFLTDISGVKKGTFVGYKKCIECHGNDEMGNQVAVWRSAPHARAFRRLSSGEAKQIAEMSGISNPTKNAACLSCHNTGAGKYEAATGEGVGCEACHGPASNWYEYENHVSLTNSKAGYKKAVSLGMYPIIGIDSIKFREKMCKRCHTIERPCRPETITDKKQLELPLEFISDFIFKHPVRR